VRVVGIEACPGDRGGDDVVEERRGGPQGCSPGAQHARVAGFQQLRGDVDGDIRPGLEVRADDTHRYPALGQPQPAGKLPEGGALGREAGVGEQPDLPRHVGDPGLVELEPVDQAAAQPICLAVRHVGGVGGQDLRGPPREQVRHRAQRTVNGLIGRPGQARRPVSG